MGRRISSSFLESGGHSRENWLSLVRLVLISNEACTAVVRRSGRLLADQHGFLQASEPWLRSIVNRMRLLVSHFPWLRSFAAVLQRRKGLISDRLLPSFQTLAVSLRYLTATSPGPLTLVLDCLAPKIGGPFYQQSVGWPFCEVILAVAIFIERTKPTNISWPSSTPGDLIDQ